MNVRYKKVWKRSIKVSTYILISSIFLACNMFTLFDALIIGANDKMRIATLISSFLMECLGFLYCAVQDINNSIKETPSKFVFDNGTSGIPFVDREELLENVIHESVCRIKNDKYYYTRNIRYGERNGKTAFAKKLCYELQKIKDKESDAVKIAWPKFAKQIGSIIYINYANYADAFNSRIKTEFTYINCTFIKK